MDYKVELEIAKEAAKKAGEKIMQIYAKDFNVCYKSDESPVTEADVAANEIIESMLRKRFPGDGFLTEESIDDESRFKCERFWIIDPLDGTKEFVKKNGEFAVNIGLITKGKICLGVVYVPCTETTFFAVDGHGAFEEKEGVVKRIHVSERTVAYHLLISRSHPSKKTLALLYDHNDRIDSITKLGSSLKGCLIANGTYDVYYNFGRSMKWDTCAVECIVHEAGGIFRKLDDQMIDYVEKDKTNYGFYILNNIKNKVDLNQLKVILNKERE